MFFRIVFLQIFVLLAFTYCMDENDFDEELFDDSSIDPVLLGSRDKNIGTRAPGDAQVHMEKTFAQPFFTTVTRNFNYTAPDNKTITRIEAKSFFQTGTADVIGGGPTFKSVQMVFKSGPFFPMFFLTRVYAV